MSNSLVSKFSNCLLQLSDIFVSYDSHQLISNKHVHAHVQSNNAGMNT